MNDASTRSRLSQESITILSVGGVVLGTAVALGALILTTTERIENRIVRVEDRLLAVEKVTAALGVRIERVEGRLLAVEEATAALRLDVTEANARLERLEAPASTEESSAAG